MQHNKTHKFNMKTFLKMKKEKHDYQDTIKE